MRRSPGQRPGGVYPVLLFREDMTGVYLTVAQGTQELKQQGRGHMENQLKAAALRVTSGGTSHVEARGFEVATKPVLGAGTLARDYEDSTIVHKFYPVGAVPRDAELLHDLEAAMSLADADAEAAYPDDDRPLGLEAFDDVVRLVSAQRSTYSGLLVPSGHGDRVRAFMAAVVTKPFVILAGMSGSGKTELRDEARRVVRRGATRSPILAGGGRGAGWTGPEALFGYEDALRPAVDGRAAWFVPETLSFLLDAAAEPDMPYLLLLDEMNLAHVERYF